MLSNAYFDLIARNTLAALVHSKSRLTVFTKAFAAACEKDIQLIEGPQLPPAPQEGTDTTPTADGPETPPEGPQEGK